MPALTWTEWLLLVPALAYVTAGTGYAARGEWGFAVAYWAYALANGGLIAAALAGRG